jgi:hypothetical protein
MVIVIKETNSQSDRIPEKEDFFYFFVDHRKISSASGPLCCCSTPFMSW